MSTTDGKGRLLRCSFRLSESDFDVRYKKCINDSVADCISRISTVCETNEIIAEEIPCYALGEENEVDTKDIELWENQQTYFEEVLATSPEQ